MKMPITAAFFQFYPHLQPERFQIGPYRKNLICNISNWGWELGVLKGKMAFRAKKSHFHNKYLICTCGLGSIWILDTFGKPTCFYLHIITHLSGKILLMLYQKWAGFIPKGILKYFSDSGVQHTIPAIKKKLPH